MATIAKQSYLRKLAPDISVFGEIEKYAMDNNLLSISKPCITYADCSASGSISKISLPYSRGMVAIYGDGSITTDKDSLENVDAFSLNGVNYLIYDDSDGRFGSDRSLAIQLPKAISSYIIVGF